MGATRALARAAERVLPRVPPEWQGPISEVAGTIAYLAAPRGRAAVRANLATIAPERALSGARGAPRAGAPPRRRRQAQRLDCAPPGAAGRPAPPPPAPAAPPPAPAPAPPPPAPGPTEGAPPGGGGGRRQPRRDLGPYGS